MASKFLLSLLLPALAVARINIEITGTMTGNPSDMTLKVSGRDVNVITDLERNSYKLYDTNVKDGVKAYFGERPTNAFLRSPTPWGDLYQSYGWGEVTRTLQPRNGKILRVNAQPSLIVSKIFENKSTKPAIFNVGVSQDVTNIVSSSWFKSGNLNVSTGIHYGVEMKPLEFGGAMEYSYTAAWGENMEKTETINVGSNTGVEVLLEPGQSVRSELMVTRGSIQVEIKYEATLEGMVAVNYNQGFKGHHFWSLPISGVMSAAGLKNSLPSEEVINIGYYSDGQVTVTDVLTNKKIMSLPVEINM